MWKSLTLFLSCASLSFANLIDDVLPDSYPDVYNIEVLPFKEHGWFNNANFMTYLIKIFRVKNVVEVGSWLGTSTRHIARVLPADGVVFAVDHWKGSEEHQESKEFEVLLPTLFQQFLSNVIHENLIHKIIPVRMDSLSAAEKLKPLNTHIDLIYLDGDHTLESVYADLSAWYPYVEKQGIICGDDWIWSGVQCAVTQFANENNLEIHSPENFWYLTKKKRKKH